MNFVLGCVCVHTFVLGHSQNCLKVTIVTISPIISPTSHTIFLYDIFSFPVQTLIFYNAQYGQTELVIFSLNLFFLLPSLFLRVIVYAVMQIRCHKILLIQAKSITKMYPFLSFPKARALDQILIIS